MNGNCTYSLIIMTEPSQRCKHSEFVENIKLDRETAEFLTNCLRSKDDVFFRDVGKKIVAGVQTYKVKSSKIIVTRNITQDETKNPEVEIEIELCLPEYLRMVEKDDNEEKTTKSSKKGRKQ